MTEEQKDLIGQATALAEEWHRSRTKAVELSATLSDLEAQRTECRNRLVKADVSGGKSKTAAEADARQSPEYVKLGAQVDATRSEWEQQMTDAQHLQMKFQIVCAQLGRELNEKEVAMELGRLQAHIRHRLRVLGHDHGVEDDG